MIGNGEDDKLSESSDDKLNVHSDDKLSESSDASEEDRNLKMK